MKKYKIVALLLTVVVMSTLFEGCTRKGEEDPFISLRSRKARMTGLWTVSSFTGNYKEELNTGERRSIEMKHTGKTVSETTEYIKMSEATQDSLKAGQDTTITWDGKIVEANYDIRKDGTFNFIYVYELEVTHSKTLSEGSSSIGIFAPTPNPFRIDSTLTRRYKTEYRGRWNFLDDIDGYKKHERIIFEVENATYQTNESTTFVYDFEDDDLAVETDTTFSTQSVEVTTHKYANGEHSIVWEVLMLKNKEAKFRRDLDYIYTYVYRGELGDNYAKKGDELVELVQETE
jgi:hypothetical protein